MPGKRQGGQHPDFADLRTLIDGNDPFMRGVQFHKARTNSGKRHVPSWANDDKRVQQIILRSFPQWRTNEDQKRDAGRWAMVIHWYFKCKMSYVETAHKMNADPEAIHSIIRSISRAAAGKRACDGKARGTPVNRNTQPGLKQQGKQPAKNRVPTPNWMYKPAQVYDFLDRVFPKREDDDRQHQQAERWEFIIHNFFLSEMSRAEIAQELHCPATTVAAAIQHIRRAGAKGPLHKGLRQDGQPRTGHSKGRPRKPGARRAVKRPKPAFVPIPLRSGPESGFEVDEESVSEE